MEVQREWGIKTDEEWLRIPRSRRAEMIALHQLEQRQKLKEQEDMKNKTQKAKYLKN